MNAPGPLRPPSFAFSAGILRSDSPKCVVCETKEVAGDVSEEVGDVGGVRMVLPADLWSSKILRDHPELSGHLADILRAVAEPDLVLPDSVFEDRRRYYLRDAGPSRWLLVVVRYEQEPARIISAFGNRKDPRSWSA